MSYQENVYFFRTWLFDNIYNKLQDIADVSSLLSSAKVKAVQVNTTPFYFNLICDDQYCGYYIEPMNLKFEADSRFGNMMIQLIQERKDQAIDECKKILDRLGSNMSPEDYYISILMNIHMLFSSVLMKSKEGYVISFQL
jgi:hypothetical protein